MDFGKLAYIKAKEFEHAKESGGVGYIGTDAKAVEILPLAEYTFDTGTLSQIFNNIEAFIEEGRSITVSLDGVEYKDTVKFATVSNGDEVFSCWYIGNLCIMGLEDTGEPFSVAIVGKTLQQVGLQMGIIDELMNGVETSTHTVSIHAAGETIHPIDPKFLPNVDSVTLNAPGGKQFKLTVDDDGAIKAIEVT